MSKVKPKSIKVIKSELALWQKLTKLTSAAREAIEADFEVYSSRKNARSHTDLLGAKLALHGILSATISHNSTGWEHGPVGMLARIDSAYCTALAHYGPHFARRTKISYEKFCEEREILEVSFKLLCE